MGCTFLVVVAVLLPHSPHLPRTAGWPIVVGAWLLIITSRQILGVFPKIIFWVLVVVGFSAFVARQQKVHEALSSATGPKLDKSLTDTTPAFSPVIERVVELNAKPGGYDLETGEFIAYPAHHPRIARPPMPSC